MLGFPGLSNSDSVWEVLKKLTPRALRFGEVRRATVVWFEAAQNPVRLLPGMNLQGFSEHALHHRGCQIRLIGLQSVPLATDPVG